MKTCTRCNSSKNTSEFGTKKTEPDGLCKVCRECRNLEARIYRRKKGLEEGKVVNSPKRVDQNATEKTCGTCLTTKPMDSYATEKRSPDGRHASCKDCRSSRMRSYRKNNPERTKEIEWARYERDHLKRRAASRAYCKTPEYKKKAKEYRAYKAENCPVYKASLYHSKLVFCALRAKSAKGIAASYEMLGYTQGDLVRHLESLFTDGMSWENKGEWHVDHIRPISSFAKEGIFDPKIISTLDNLQPLWAFDNISKGDKWPG